MSKWRINSCKAISALKWLLCCLPPADGGRESKLEPRPPSLTWLAVTIPLFSAPMGDG